MPKKNMDLPDLPQNMSNAIYNPKGTPQYPPQIPQGYQQSMVHQKNGRIIQCLETGDGSYQYLILSNDLLNLGDIAILQ